MVTPTIHATEEDGEGIINVTTIHGHFDIKCTSEGVIIDHWVDDEIRGTFCNTYEELAEFLDGPDEVRWNPQED